MSTKTAQPAQTEHERQLDREQHGVAIGDRVQHIRDDSWVGTAVHLDRNLGYPTTCGVVWDDDDLKAVDVHWTNKLRVLPSVPEAVAA